MTWIAKVLTIAWVSAEERRSWGFTAGAATILVVMIVTSGLMKHGASDFHELWYARRASGGFGALGCVLLLPILVALVRQALGLVARDDGDDLPLVLPVWMLLLAAAVGGRVLHESWLGFQVIAGCAVLVLAMRAGDLRCGRRRAQFAEQVARGRLLTDPWDCAWYGKLADALAAQGKRDEALKVLQRWRVRDPWSCEPHQRIGELRARPSSSIGRPAFGLLLLVVLGVATLAAATGSFVGILQMTVGGLVNLGLGCEL